MGLNSYAKKRDANEREIIEALEARGHKVKQTDFIDLVVQRKGDQKIVLLEVKSKNGRLTKSQEQMLWEGWVIHIVRTPQEAIDAVESEEFVA